MLVVRNFVVCFVYLLLLIFNTPFAKANETDFSLLSNELEFIQKRIIELHSGLNEKDPASVKLTQNHLHAKAHYAIIKHGINKAFEGRLSYQRLDQVILDYMRVFIERPEQMLNIDEGFFASFMTSINPQDASKRTLSIYKLEEALIDSALSLALVRYNELMHLFSSLFDESWQPNPARMIASLKLSEADQKAAIAFTEKLLSQKSSMGIKDPNDILAQVNSSLSALNGSLEDFNNKLRVKASRVNIPWLTSPKPEISKQARDAYEAYRQQYLSYIDESYGLLMLSKYSVKLLGGLRLVERDLRAEKKYSNPQEVRFRFKPYPLLKINDIKSSALSLLTDLRSELNYLYQRKNQLKCASKDHLNKHDQSIVSQNNVERLLITGPAIFALFLLEFPQYRDQIFDLIKKVSQAKEALRQLLAALMPDQTALKVGVTATSIGLTAIGLFPVAALVQGAGTVASMTNRTRKIGTLSHQTYIDHFEQERRRVAFLCGFANKEAALESQLIDYRLSQSSDKINDELCSGILGLVPMYDVVKLGLSLPGMVEDGDKVISTLDHLSQGIEKACSDPKQRALLKRLAMHLGAIEFARVLNSYTSASSEDQANFFELLKDWDESQAEQLANALNQLK